MSTHRKFANLEKLPSPWSGCECRETPDLLSAPKGFTNWALTSLTPLSLWIMFPQSRDCVNILHKRRFGCAILRLACSFQILRMHLKIVQIPRLCATYPYSIAPLCIRAWHEMCTSTVLCMFSSSCVVLVVCTTYFWEAAAIGSREDGLLAQCHSSTLAGFSLLFLKLVNQEDSRQLRHGSAKN